MCGGFRRLLFFSLPPRGEGAPVLTLGRMRGQVSDWGRCTQRGFRSYLRAKSRPSGGGFLSQRWERNQWPRPPSLGTAGQFTLRIAGGRGRRALRVHRTAYPRTLLRGTPYCLILLDFRRTKSEWLSASPFGPLGPGHTKILTTALSELRLTLSSQHSWCVSRREPQGAPLRKTEAVLLLS